ncbi:hypothetical protein D3C84_911000 [compost metagenome]
MYKGEHRSGFCTSSNVLQHISNMLPTGFFITHTEVVKPLHNLIHQLYSRDTQHHRAQGRNCEGEQIKGCQATVQQIGDQHPALIGIRILCGNCLAAGIP